jgi:tetratricopeptide (TPR) repeat protein
LKILLEKWEKTEPANPEVYIAYFNYYCNLDAKESVATGEMPDGSYGLYSTWEYNKNNVYEGIKYLDKALPLLPNRLDMYWGKMEALLAIEDYKAAGETLSALIEISPEYNDSWALGGGRPVNDGEVDGERYFLDYINRYYSAFLNEPSGEAANALTSCAGRQIKTYPESTYAYNMLAVYYIYQNSYETALEYLLMAEKADGSDCIVLLNIGRLYAETGNNAEAKAYLNKVITAGDAEEQDTARYYLDEYNL